MKKRYIVALLAITFYAGAYTAVTFPPTNYTFAGKHFGAPSHALFSSPGELLSAECHVDGTASTAFKNVFEENTKSLAPEGAEVPSICREYLVQRDPSSLSCPMDLFAEKPPSRGREECHVVR